ncbi:MAG: sigma 54-interacting transcriptional regulator [Myxococcales bacterium]|nr:sigma 54-interacting transcriptional regulator [Myxococcales bacterium]
MAIFHESDAAAADAIARLCYTNPFGAERIPLEKRALGSQHRDVQETWSLGEHGQNPNLDALAERAQSLLLLARKRLGEGAARSAADSRLLEDLVRYHLFYRFEDPLLELALRSAGGGLPAERVEIFDDFRREAERLCELPGPPLALRSQLPHLFAILFQLRRAFSQVYEYILGASSAAVRLRAAVWESIFTHDMRRYQQSLYGKMHEITTLITGPSGTGKELVARAVGLSRYIPFDASARRFQDETAAAFHPLNISALASTVLESELFGHQKGSFTGATHDRRGWLEACARHGTVFLDEIGELEPSIQVKLLRVLQTRQFARVGATELRHFEGKLIAATNRDLAAEMRAGRFREDFYYRLCADAIETPALSDQLRERPEDLRLFVRSLVARLVPEEQCGELVDDVVGFVESELAGYHWPGNVRELEQCVRAVIVRGRYKPVGSREASTALAQLTHRIERTELDADALLDAYITLVYQRTGSYVEAARRLGLDRRTVKARVDAKLLAALRDDG